MLKDRDIDLLYELREIADVKVFAVTAQRFPDWPSVLVELPTFDPYVLGQVTAAIIRADPNEDRSDIGVIDSDRLRSIFGHFIRRIGIPEGAWLSARERAEERAKAPPRFRIVAPQPIVFPLEPIEAAALPVGVPASPRLFFRLSNRRLVEVVVADPFPAWKDIILVIGASALVKRVVEAAPNNIVVHKEGLAADAKVAPTHIVCAEDWALPALREMSDEDRRKTIVITDVDADWVSDLIEGAIGRRVTVLERPSIDELGDALGVFDVDDDRDDMAEFEENSE